MSDCLMTNHWFAGDLAVCIGNGPWMDADAPGDSARGPQDGDVHPVIQVTIEGDGKLALKFARWPGIRLAAVNFLKLYPDNDLGAIARERVAA